MGHDDSPPQIYNRTLFLSVFVFGILGAARGYDEGCISGNITLPSFKSRFGLADTTKSADYLANLKSNITSMVQLGSIGGSIIAMYTVDKLGRVRALQAVCILWIIGAAIQVSAGSVGQLYAGRLIEGLAIGQTTTIGPSMTEIAPNKIRGLCVCIFSGAVYFGIFLGYCANYGSVLHQPNDSDIQWRITVSLKIVLAGIIFILSFLFCLESPRWLLQVNRPDEAIKNLSKLRHLPIDHPYIVAEVSDINEQVLEEKEAVESSNIFEKFKSIFTVKSYRYRFFAVSALAQILGQWSGANAITIYASELFSFAGIKGTDQLKMSAVLGVVKFISAYLSAFFIIDFLGRRRALYVGISVQLLSILYFAIFITIVPQADDVNYVLSPSQSKAARAALAAVFLSGTGWTMGFNSIQYLVGSEMFPLKIRSFAQSLVMVLHFGMQYGNSKAVPKMLLAMNNYGAFYFFVGVMVMSLFWAWFFVPEVTGRSLESMEDIFNLPWYIIGRKGPELCPDYSEINKITHTTSRGNTYVDNIAYNIDQSKIEQAYIEDINNNKAESLLRRDSEDKENEKKL
ncbi:quinate permease [Scheffersomyces stipitis CBS 6054]|uniref:Quinate permease n=1 Tax=Scheffersomyces stipitis (strain ATCC 58785 / CBS 6054 / NBRC 10063 / NRRL Y-11545) TaxID=322104 RepID=A3GG74_PICST|nr:quinate permease [Scheffersomyces stipitis CBS 6054]EAZ63468.1 quinate permease [Scheffersomyces stipitis CBS 6054]